MKKLSESIWGDIRKKSLGQEERQENAFNPDYIDFGDDTTVYWTKKTIDINGNNRFLFDEIKDYNNNGWRLPTFEEVNQINWYDCKIYSHKGDTYIKLQNGEFIIECGDLGNINMWMKEEKSNFMKNSYGYNNNQGTHEFSIKRFNRNYSTLYLLLVKDKK